jgi:NADPH:quinone reductase-like Zn-dependent oxidoreductase
MTATTHTAETTDIDRQTMQAIVRDTYGSPDEVLELENVAMPGVGDGEVLVRVHAAGVAIGDWLTMTGMPYIARPQYGLLKPKHRIGGHEFAGIVAAVGASVTGFHPGDEVFGWSDDTLAEYVAVPAEAVVGKPANLTLEQAAAVPISGLAALEALRDTGNVEHGDKVLILGASGAVGTFAVQVAKALGAEVTGVVSTRNVEMVRSIGADHVIDYTKQDIAQSGQQYDVILDLAGNRALPALRRALTPNGTLVIVGGSGGKWFMGFGRTIRAMLMSPFVSQRLRPFISKPSKENLVALRELIDAGRVNPVIDRTFPLSATAAAMAYLAERHTQGKTVITV